MFCFPFLWTSASNDFMCAHCIGRSKPAGMLGHCFAIVEKLQGANVYKLEVKSWNLMAQAQKTVFVFRRNGRVHLIRRGRQFSRLLPAEVCASTVVMLDTPCSEVVWRVLATHSIRQFPLHFPSRAPSHFNWSLHRTTGIILLLRSAGGPQNFVCSGINNWRVTFCYTNLMIYQQLLFISYFSTGHNS